VYWKQAGEVIAVSRDGATVDFSFRANAFADIANATAWPASDSLTLTAAKNEADRANVEEGRRGDYRAYRVHRLGIETLTSEYTNTAIPLLDNSGLAYSNGGSLVVVRGDVRQTFRLGRFSWGPTSVSCDAAGRWIGMTKWRGDDRKVAFLDPAKNTLAISRFSHYSYLLYDDSILYTHGSVSSYSPTNNKSTTIFPLAKKRGLLEELGLEAGWANKSRFFFNNLSILNGTPVLSLRIADVRSYEEIWQGVITLPVRGGPFEILYTTQSPWQIKGITSNGRLLAVALERYQDARLADHREVFVDRTGERSLGEWTLVSAPFAPDHRFQFLPRP
jgi:hypothetical protein